MKKRLGKKIAILLSVYFVYSLIGFVLPVYMVTADPREDSRTMDLEGFYRDEIGPDRVVLLEDPEFSGISRLHLMDRAQERIRVAYFSVHEGLASQLFYGTILSAADRGVEVELLFDGIFHNLGRRNRETHRALVNHENIDIRFYEPLNLIKPWTWNNRMHDKFMVVDGTYAITGGRNIGDQYFLESSKETLVKDRDVLVFKEGDHRQELSVLSDFDQYFQRLWESEYTKQKDQQVAERHRGSAEEKTYELLNLRREIEREHPEKFPGKIDWQGKSHPTKKITLITNSLDRLEKDPRILEKMAELMETAEESVVIQSPYVIPTDTMRAYFDHSQAQNKRFVLTNSKAASPNYFGIAGYLNHREDIASHTEEIFEYAGAGSIHGKSYIFDQRISMVGSFNMDARSAFLSTENMVVIDSRSFASRLSQAKEELVRESVPYREPGPSDEGKAKGKESVPRYKEMVIKIMGRMLSPFDDML